MEGPSHIPKFLISYLTSHLISPMSQFRFHLSPFTYLKVGNSMKHRLWPQELQQALSIAAPPAGLSRMRTLSILQHPGLGKKTHVPSRVEKNCRGISWFLMVGFSAEVWWLEGCMAKCGDWTWRSHQCCSLVKILGRWTRLRTMYSDADVTCVLFCFNTIMVL